MQTLIKIQNSVLNETTLENLYNVCMLHEIQCSRTQIKFFQEKGSFCPPKNAKISGSPIGLEVSTFLL